ncbi:hypothetical protein GGX14DRAFT_578223 [Mycena pura]|uniref:Uncharacterized protein n=1 Tax=Mycena pura TaxID=153505 RepID=A0AAD6Y5H4_9AGAR|nr:hypothetical protein GGX14DRAFT_578223 [Mycena pura]
MPNQVSGQDYYGVFLAANLLSCTLVSRPQAIPGLHRTRKQQTRQRSQEHGHDGHKRAGAGGPPQARGAPPINEPDEPQCNKDIEGMKAHKATGPSSSRTDTCPAEAVRVIEIQAIDSASTASSRWYASIHHGAGHAREACAMLVVARGLAAATGTAACVTQSSFIPASVCLANVGRSAVRTNSTLYPAYWMPQLKYLCLATTTVWTRPSPYNHVHVRPFSLDVPGPC